MAEEIDETLPEVGTPEAMSAAHAVGQAAVHGAIKAPTVKPSEEPAPAGKYTVLVKVWNELVSGPSEVTKRFVKHHRGAKVELDSANAERLLRAGAVAPTTTAQAASPAAQSESPLDKAVAINDQVGAKPVEDQAPQQPVADQT